MRRKTAIGVAVSGLVHLILVYTLLSPPVAEVAVVEQDQIEVDFRTVGTVTAPPLDDALQKVDRASRAAGESMSSGKLSKGESGTTFRLHPSDSGSATAMDSETKPDVLSPSPNADRLWSLRAVPGVELTPFVNKLAAEDPSILFRHAVPNVIKNPRKSVPSEVVEGHGDVKMHLDPNGRIAGLEDPKAKVGFAIGLGFIGVGGRFDLNDVLIRAIGKQPYRYEQHRLAEATRDERICQMVEAEAQDKRQALFGLKEQLHRIWGMHDTSLLQKQTLIFELWDECLEEQSEDSVGVMARATIEAFVRRNMPFASAKAIPAELLATLNHGRRSRRAFAPYQGQNPDAGR